MGDLVLRACSRNLLVDVEPKLDPSQPKVTKSAIRLCEDACAKRELPDKIFKAGDAILDLGLVIGDATDAPDGTMTTLAETRKFAKVGRDAMGLFNIFAGVMRGLVRLCITFFMLLRAICAKSQEPVDLKWFTRPKGFDVKNAKYSDLAIGSKQQWLAVLSTFGKIFSAATYTVGFGIQRPISNLEKYAKVELSQTARDIGDAFPTVMMVNHVGGVWSGIMDLAYQNTAYKDAIARGENTAKTYQIYVNSLPKIVVGTVEKSLELTMDIARHVVSPALPAYVRLPFTLAIGAFGITKACLEAT